MNNGHRRTFVPMLLFAGFIIVGVAGCRTQLAPVWNVNKNGIDGEIVGDPHFPIVGMTIDVKALTKEQSHNIWILVGASEPMYLDNITEGEIRELGRPAETHYLGQIYNDTYYVGGTSLRFEEGKLVTIIDQGMPGINMQNIKNPAKWGSRTSGKTLSLPCSLVEFEEVFGKEDSITQGYGL